MNATDTIRKLLAIAEDPAASIFDIIGQNV